MEVAKRTILYVDDEEHNLFTFRAAFRRDYEVFTAISGEEGLNILRTNDIHLIIADQRMPGMTGVHFLEQARLEFPNPIRMILTGYSDVGAVIDAINAGQVFRYLTKPWNKTEMKLTIDQALDFFHLEQQNSRLFLDLEQAMTELKRTLRRFKQYIPEAVVSEALQTTEEALIRGERREVAVLFCDIRDFTSLSEVLEPEMVVSFLNAFYSGMDEIVRRHKGTVAQFIGDEIFAVFGAPVQDNQLAINAVYAALEMREKGRQLSRQFAGRLGRELHLGIGVNCGQAIVGNVGSTERISYSVVGDTVNTAKRIESLTREHPDAILIRDCVYARVAGHIDAAAWDPVPVKGKAEPIVVYEVRGRK